MPSSTGTLRWSANHESRKRSTLQPPPLPLSGPGVPMFETYIPLSPPPRGSMPRPIRPLILPPTPITPSCLPPSDWNSASEAWEDQSGNLHHIRQMDSMPMFRFSDLEDVHGGAIAQSYMIDRLETPRVIPYSITAMLNDPECPVDPMSSPPTMNQFHSGQSITLVAEQDMGRVDYSEDDVDIEPLTLPSPMLGSFPSCAQPCKTYKRSLLNSHSSPSDTFRPRLSPSAVDATRLKEPCLNLTSSTTTVNSTASQVSPAMNISPRTLIPSPVVNTGHGGEHARQIVCSGPGWWSVNATGDRRGRSRFREELSISAPEEYFDHGHDVDHD